jgi:hypothetical protein
MIDLIKGAWHDFLHNQEYARTRLRALVSVLGTVAGGFVATGVAPSWIPEKYGPFVMGASFVVASAIGQGEKNK